MMALCFAFATMTLLKRKRCLPRKWLSLEPKWRLGKLLSFAERTNWSNIACCNSCPVSSFLIFVLPLKLKNIRMVTHCVHRDKFHFRAICVFLTILPCVTVRFTNVAKGMSRMPRKNRTANDAQHRGRATYARRTLNTKIDCYDHDRRLYCMVLGCGG